jgi:hypothetical protein
MATIRFGVSFETGKPTGPRTLARLHDESQINISALQCCKARIWHWLPTVTEFASTRFDRSNVSFISSLRHALQQKRATLIAALPD